MGGEIEGGGRKEEEGKDGGRREGEMRERAWRVCVCTL